MRPETVSISVVIPFYNEEASILSVCEEVREVLSALPELTWELVMVNDGSTDATGQIMDETAQNHSGFRAVHITPNSGQSAALQAGFEAAHGEFIATLDGDGQNDPRDIPRLLAALKEQNLDMMCGIRSQRADNFIRRISSRIANRTRSFILGDNITDVGCSLRIFRRACLKHVRFFRNAHRFFPALFLMAGYSVSEMPVNHRPRQQGTSKYGGGINSRLWVGIADLLGVLWLSRRSLRYTSKENNGPELR